MFRFLLTLSFASLVPASALAGGASDLVASFYVDPGSEFSVEKRELFAGPARAFLDKAEAAWERDETVCIEFVLSIDGQDYDEAEVARTLVLTERPGDGGVEVTASFSNFGQATTVVWTIAELNGVHKVADIRSDENAWKMSAFKCD